MKTDTGPLYTALHTIPTRSSSPKSVAAMMRSAVKCAASVRVSALPLVAQPQVSIHNILRHPFDLMKL